MKFSRTSIALASCFATGTLAMPALSSLVARKASGVVVEIAQIIGKILGEWGDSSHPAWDYGHHRDACSIKMYTHNGANCEVTIECVDNYKKEWKGSDFNVCYIGGRQFFTDEQLGEFSITFEGEARQTLGWPVLQFKDIDNWARWEISDLAVWSDDQEKKSNGGMRICNSKPEGFEYDSGGKGGELIYQCGVPKRGKQVGDVDSNMENNESGYAPGWCGLHVTQHQKPDPSKDQYRFDIKLYDANEALIGELNDQVADKVIEVPSKLPLLMLVEGGRVDDDPVLFKYGSQAFGSNDQEHHCNFGGYDNMKREGDCGFSC